MYKRIITLLAVFAVPASMSFAQTKSLPESWTKEEVTIFDSIEAAAAKILSSDKIVSLKTSENRIKQTFTDLVRTYGVDKRLVIAKAVSTLVPEELHGYVAKRALSYSPLRAKELLASLSNNGSNASVSSALSSLPTGSVHSVSAASAVGVSLDQGRVFQLPQVDARRRVTSHGGGMEHEEIVEADSFGGAAFSRGSGGRVSTAEGSVEIGGVTVAVTIELKPIQDNGFTTDGMGYLVKDGAGNLIGEYMYLQEDTATQLTLKYKNFIDGNPTPGTGDNLEVIVAGTL
jgi:hypothetical protein